MYSSQREDDGDSGDAKEFPILCETCLGDNPYVRMTREPHGKACKICERPFTIFRWRPGSDARYKKTEKKKQKTAIVNSVLCSCVMASSHPGLPVQVRDSVLAEHERVNLASEDVNRGFQIEQLEKAMENGSAALPYGKVAPSALLQRMARKQPYYKRNQAHICSFFVRGECNRGSACPYRHEMPVTGELANQNIKDRFHGNNDPVAKKMLNRFSGADRGGIVATPPEDQSITTLWVGGLDDAVGEEDLRDKFYQYGAIASVRVVTMKQCAFVTFSSRKGAEDAAAGLKGCLTIRGLRLRVDWGKSIDTSSSSRVKRVPPGLSIATASGSIADGLAENLPAFLPPPPGMDSMAHYPSMDSRQMQAKFSARDD